MKLTNPDDIDTPDGYAHPLSEETVERAHTMVEPAITPDATHDHLETVQAALEHKLSKPASLFDPLDIWGKVVHWLAPAVNDPRYSNHLYMEDGRYGFDDDRHLTLALASKQAADELGENPDYAEFEERYQEIADDLDLDNYTEEEKKDAFGTKFDIWQQVADLLDVERDSSTLKVVKAAHELAYHSRARHKSNHATTGFVIGVPPLFWAGMRTEQRMFSALANTKMSPAQIVDAYGSRVSYQDNMKWGSKRGVSQSAVSQNRSKAQSHLTTNYDPGTYPEDILLSHDNP